MSFFDKLFSGSIGKLLNAGKDIIDEFVTTDEERQEAKLKFEEMVRRFELEQAKEISDRHKYDMQSDSFLSKNIRPFLVLFSLFTITIFALLDASIGGFEIPIAYIDLMGQVLLAGIGFYFVSRSFDKKKVNDSLTDLAKEREKTIRERSDLHPIRDLPKVSLSKDNE